IAECLESIFSQDYPKHKIELIVIDDGSKDGTGNLVSMFPCKLLSHQKSRGQSYCRNLGARKANGEILAFLDSDCVAGTTWLKEIVTYFQWDSVGAVGGYVDSYFTTSPLDRYEETYSPLNMGKRFLCDTDEGSTFYVPTCNLLVQREAFLRTGGFQEQMDLGEDVDFCWRMRAKGYDTLYVPVGAVKHKHRNELGKMLKRRRDYGTSEATLYTLHPEKKKTFQIPLLATVSFFSLCAAILLLSMLPLFVAGACFLFEVWMKVSKLARMSLCIPLRRICFSVARIFVSCSDFASFHVVRYYLVALFLLGFAAYHVWLLSLFVLLVASMVDYHLKKPQLNFLQFLFYYVLDHMAYQMGVIAGCIHKRTLGSYVPRFVRRTAVTLL
ncbi:MAG: mycofactocin biosynthesis glycosyltransferase MftF, partial [Nitrospirota bacterium]|nr:mycofactocin biosynthesis glycosyltransferase MftF [Nitrospirota bacterium]